MREVERADKVAERKVREGKGQTTTAGRLPTGYAPSPAHSDHRLSTPVRMLL
jgi:hypothetical protein